MSRPSMRTVAACVLLASLSLAAACSGGVSPPPAGDDDDDDDDDVFVDAARPDGGGGSVDARSPDAPPPPDAPVPQDRRVCATGAPYTTIGAAIAAASAGDTILVCAGRYPERIVLDRALTVRGDGAATTTIDATGGDTVVTVQNTREAVVV